MASIAVDKINDIITELQDKKRTAEQAFRVQAEAHALDIAALEQELADWAEVLDRYHLEPEPQKPARKTAATKK